MRDGKLSPKQRAFCLAYIELKEGEAAAVKAKYSPKAARQIASRLLTKANIKAEIKRLEGLREKKGLMKADEVEAELDRLIRFNLKEFVDPKTGEAKPLHELTDEQAACVREFATIETSIGTSRNLKFYDKIAAIRTKLERLKLIGEQPQKLRVEFVFGDK
jgi:phage terminase small subunit